jgi:DNA invertase Pin-like site-specific DNA recombinase
MESSKQKIIECAVYARPNRAGDHTAEMKLELCRAGAALRGLTIADNHVFKDEGLHAKLDLGSRPGFLALIEAANEDRMQFRYVMVDATETLSRVISEVLNAFSQLSRLGIILVAAKDLIKTNG